MTARQDLVNLVESIRAGTGPARNPYWRKLTVDASMARRAAVLILFGALDNVPAESDKPLAPADLDVLLLERAHTLDDHPGQVAFPGGGIDPDESPIAAALRVRESCGVPGCSSPSPRGCPAKGRTAARATCPRR